MDNTETTKSINWGGNNVAARGWSNGEGNPKVIILTPVYDDAGNFVGYDSREVAS